MAGIKIYNGSSFEDFCGIFVNDGAGFVSPNDKSVAVYDGAGFVTDVSCARQLKMTGSFCGIPVNDDGTDPQGNVYDFCTDKDIYVNARYNILIEGFEPNENFLGGTSLIFVDDQGNETVGLNDVFGNYLGNTASVLGTFSFSSNLLFGGGITCGTNGETGGFKLRFSAGVYAYETDVLDISFMSSGSTTTVTKNATDYRCPNNYQFDNGVSIDGGADILRVCINEFIAGSFIYSATIENPYITGEYKGESIVSVTANVTDGAGDPVAINTSTSNTFITWTNATGAQTGNICGFTVVTTGGTYTLDQACYDLSTMTFTPNTATEVCAETLLTVTKT